MKGTLQKVRFPEVLVRVAARKETGVLRLTHHQIEKTVYFQDGNVIFSQSNDVDDRLGPLLLRQQKITSRQLNDCEPKVSPEKRLGTILVLEGYIQPDDLVRGVTDQVKEIIYSLFDWEEGTYEFIPGNLPTSEIITLNLSIPDLVLNGMARIQRWSWISKGVGSLDEVFRKRAGWTTVVRKMILTTETETLLDLFDRPRTLEEILQLSPAGSFETCRRIWFFLIAGIIEQILQPPQWEEEEDEIEFSEAIPENLSLKPTAASNLEEPAENIAPPASVGHADPLPMTNFAEPASPTLKIELPEIVSESTFQDGISLVEPSDTATMPVQELSQQRDATSPPLPVFDHEAMESSNIELSFSDLADLTDAAQEMEPVPEPVAEKPVIKREDMDLALRAFNDLHRFIFELVRLEIGPGALDFIAKTLKKASTKFPLLFEGVQMDDFGELDQNSLMMNIEGNLVEDYQQAFDFLLEEERSQIRMFLEPKRVEVIEAGLKKMLERQKTMMG